MSFDDRAAVIHMDYGPICRSRRISCVTFADVRCMASDQTAHMRERSLVDTRISGRQLGIFWG